jgi:hypothetical protein
MWAGTSQDGLFILEKGSSALRRIDLTGVNTFANQITALDPLDENTVLVSTIQNVFSVDFDKTRV